MKGIVAHWTVGKYKANATDRQHYHFIVEGDGNIVAGTHVPEDNENVHDGNYAAHTQGMNTGFIGISMASMLGAVENPFESGQYPFKPVQWTAMCQYIAKLSKQYKFKISPTTCMTHAEVQPVMGIKQNGKWDITRIPFRPDIVGWKACGNFLRAEVSKYVK